VSEHDDSMKSGMGGYGNLFLALGISLITMYPLTMIFVADRSDFMLNLSNAYMALLMVAPMGIIMLVVMRGMFPNRMLNLALGAGFVLLFVASLWLGRTQAFVGNEQFLRAMIPHHSRAILVCEEASISDEDIAMLCDQIIATQQEEIDIMNQLLDRE
jgi:hypothetical protein